MKGTSLAVIIVCIIAVAGAGIAIAVVNNNENYSVDYVMDGGVNSAENPSSYKAGDSFTLKPATREGYTFTSWYTDANHTKEIKEITSDSRCNYKLYAGWSANSYSITYVLNGGVNSEENPSSYRTEDEFTFKDPTREGYIFTGWYYDQGFKKEITGVSADMMSDLTIYAQWDVSSVGTVMNYDMSGHKCVSNLTTRTITGSISYSYLHYKYGKGYMIGYDERYNIKDTSNNIVESITDSDTYWTSENSTMTWILEDETKTITTIDGSKECKVWTGKYNNEVETQYEGVDNGRTYRIEYTDKNWYSNIYVTYELVSIESIKIEEEYEVKAYCDVGITVTGGGVNPAYSNVTLIASTSPDTKFSGWYTSTGTLVSTSEKYVIDTLLTDVTIFAKNDNENDVSFTTTNVSISPVITLTDVKWMYKDPVTETKYSDVLDHTFSQGGIHTIIYEGKTSDNTTYYGLYDVLTDGIVTKTYDWKYRNTVYSTSMDIMYSDFKEYRDNDISRKQGTNSHDLKFVTYQDKYIKELTDKLKSMATGMSDLEFANFVLAFTQYIEYLSDEETMGQDEYWKYPVETLFDQNGDCEDTSILFCAIIKAAGYKCCELLFSGHMAAGIAVYGCTGTNIFIKGGVAYYYCETTGAGYSVGDYIKSGGSIDYRYTQGRWGSTLQRITVVV